MHAACYRSRMTEETFQILFDVMERHFAALSLPDPASDPKITRAISFSELPSSRRILIEQCYQTDDSGNLIRQYSCEQIFDKSSNTREVKVSEIVRAGSESCLTNTWKTTLPVFGVVGNARWYNTNFGHKVKAIEAKSREPSPTKKMESMEIDVKPFKRPFPKKTSKKVPIIELNGMSLSDSQPDEKPLIRASTFGMMSTSGGFSTSKPAIRSRSTSPTIIAERSIKTDSKLIETFKTEDNNVEKSDRDIKKNLRSLMPEKSDDNSTKSRCSSCKIIFFILLSLSTAIIAMICHNVDRVRNERGFDFANMSIELRENVYGQKNAVEQLIKDLRKSSSGINLVTLVGGTGVGKSLAVGIVRKHFPHSDHVFEYFAPLRKTLHEVFHVLSQRHCNLIIMENLMKTDLQEVKHFITFTRKRTDYPCVYVIAVFNPQETDERLERKLNLKESIDEISSYLKVTDLEDANVIGFETLDEQSLNACVQQAAKEKNVHLSDSQLIEIRNTLIFANSGCKGAYAKVQLLTNS